MKLCVPNFDISEPILNCFRYEGLDIQLIDALEDIHKIDIIPFEGVRLFYSDKDFLKSLRNHKNYQISKSNPNLPVLFFHEHEGLCPEDYYHFILEVKKELGIDSSKIIVYDTNIFDRKGVINPPLSNKIKQFNLNNFDNIEVKTKKFTFLSNRTRKLRLQVLDKILNKYQNDISSLKKENTITFRNLKSTKPSSDVSDFQDIIDNSKYYDFKNNIDFYKSIGLPWVIDDFNIGTGYLDMHRNMYDIYSQSFFSISIETEWYYYDLDSRTVEKNFTTFSEKSLLPLCVGNLPFIIHNKEFYKQFENIGFDFSYLKTLFGIDYQNNTLQQNFDQIDNFISYMKINSLDKIKEDYDSLESIVDNNKNLLKDIYNNKIDESFIEYISKIKTEK